MVLEGTFGWGWISDELAAAGLNPHLASSGKVAGWRQARGIAKSNRTDADLLSELWSERQRWWEVWLAPPAVRQQREWLRYRMTLVRLQTGLKNRIQTFGRCGSSERRERSGVPAKRLVRQHEWIVEPIENDPARSDVRTSVTCCPRVANCFFPLRSAAGGKNEVKVRPGVVQLAAKEASRRTNRLETPA